MRWAWPQGGVAAKGRGTRVCGLKLGVGLAGCLKVRIVYGCEVILFFFNLWLEEEEEEEKKEEEEMHYF